jgi:hypothetical protein
LARTAPHFVAARPWSGGSIGHQIVINGFTWNAKTGAGSFHIVNSWRGLPEFDIDLEAVDVTTLVFERSLSPIGEVPPKIGKKVVESVTFIRSAGSTNLYRV